MNMYEARQNKEKVSRRIDGGRKIRHKSEINPQIQRMILPLWAKEEDKNDMLNQANLQKEYGHGEIAYKERNWFIFKTENIDLSIIGETEDLHIIAHGSPIVIAGMNEKKISFLFKHSWIAFNI